jgi:hypothetical protein
MLNPLDLSAHPTSCSAPVVESLPKIAEEIVMTAKDAIRYALISTQNMMGTYLGDLSDADLLVRPVQNANHIAWQLGHLIVSEQRLLSNIPGAKLVELPAGFAERHTKETSSIEPPRGFGTKAEYLNLFNKTREATLATLADMTDAMLDRPNPGQMKDFAPTLGNLLLLISNHTLMHQGQFSAVRRKLGKPVLF